MGLHRGGVARQFILQTAENSPMVFRQYRFPSYPSSEFTDSQLQLGTMPRSASIVSEREADDVAFELEIFHFPFLGRTEQEADRFSPPEGDAKRTKTVGAALKK